MKQIKDKKIIGNLISLSILQGLNVLIPVLIMPYLLNVLGVTQYGIFSFAFAVIQYYLLFVEFGFNLNATAKISINRNDKAAVDQIFWNITYAKIVLTIICYLVNIVLLLAVNKLEIYANAINIMFLIVVSNALFPVWLFQGLEKLKVVTIINALSKICVFPLLFFYVKEPGDINTAVVIQTGVFLVSASLSVFVIYYYKLINFKPIKIQLHKIKNEIIDSSSIFFSNLVISIYTILFVIILGFFCLPVQVGYYSAAEKIVRAITFLIYIPVSQVFFPKLTYLAVHNKEEAKLLLKKIYKLVAIIMSVAGVLIYLSSGFIAGLLGDEYHAIIPLLKILSPVPLLIALGGITGQLALLAFGYKKQFQISYMQSGVIALASVFILTYLFKEIGTGIALLIAEAAVFIFMYVKAKRYKII